MLDGQLQKNQVENRKQLLVIVLSIQLLVKQNIPFQGSTKEKGNLHQLMSLINKLTSINHTLPHEHLCSTIQNEIMSLMGEDVKGEEHAANSEQQLFHNVHG